MVKKIFSLVFIAFILPTSLNVFGMCIDRRFVINEQLKNLLVEKINEEYPGKTSIVDTNKILYTIVVKEIDGQEYVSDIRFRVPAMNSDGKLMVEYYIRMIPVIKGVQVVDAVQMCCYSDSFVQGEFALSVDGTGWYGGLYDMPGMYEEYTDIDENKPFADLLPQYDEDDDDDDEEATGEISWADIGMRIVEVKAGETCLVNVCRG